MNDIQFIDDFGNYINELPISKKDVCLVGSACLAVRELRKNNDLDFAVRPKHRPEILSNPPPEGVDLSIEKYGHIGWTDTELIENSEWHTEHNGFKIVRPEISLSFKATRQKEKDYRDFEFFVDIINESKTWDWEMFRYNYSPPSSSSGPTPPFLVRLASSLVRRGVLGTCRRTTEIIYQNKIAPRVNNSSITTKLHQNLKRTLNTNEMISTTELFAKQFQDGQFQRYDIVLEWIRQRDYDKSSRNQRQRQTNDGARKETPVTVTPEYQILDPEQFVTYLSSDLVQMPISFRRDNRDSVYDLEWLYKQKPDIEDEVIERAKTQLFDAAGINFYFNAWSPIEAHFDSIPERIGCEFDVIKTVEVDLGENLESFIDEMYDDHDKWWWIEYKKHELRKQGSTILIIKARWPTESTQTPDASQIVDLKKAVRDEYYAYVPDDYYHMILHGPDSFAEAQKIKSVIETYVNTDDFIGS